MIQFFQVSLIPTHGGRTLWEQKINGNFEIINVSCIGSNNGGISFIKGVGFDFVGTAVRIEFDNTGTSNKGIVLFALVLKSEEKLTLNGVPTLII